MSVLAPLRRRVRELVRGQNRLILLYHRVTELRLDPQQLSVSPAHFDEHLQVLRSDFAVVPLRQVQTCSTSGRPAAAITFDDGYADNVVHAKPLLESHATPATVFVASGAVGSRDVFWWDELERIWLHDRALPESLELTIGGVRRRWRAESAVKARDHRLRMYMELCEALRPLAPDNRDDVVRQLREWSGVSAAARPTHRALSNDELRQLADGPLIEIGAHTVRHPQLGAIPAAKQQIEVLESKRHLERLLERPIVSFSYPFGTRRDYDATTVGLVKTAGFERACANVADRLTRRTSPWELPRILVRDWDGDTFARNLRAVVE
jgi:peptidoglycan/xylan/chitin deacetylase (PgdA/CDA1 family)